MNARDLFHLRHFSVVFLLQHESRILTTVLSAAAKNHPFDILLFINLLMICTSPGLSE